MKIAEIFFLKKAIESDAWQRETSFRGIALFCIITNNLIEKAIAHFPRTISFNNFFNIRVHKNMDGVITMFDVQNKNAFACICIILLQIHSRGVWCELVAADPEGIPGQSINSQWGRLTNNCTDRGRVEDGQCNIISGRFNG